MDRNQLGGEGSSWIRDSRLKKGNFLETVFNFFLILYISICIFSIFKTSIYIKFVLYSLLFFFCEELFKYKIGLKDLS